MKKESLKTFLTTVVTRISGIDDIPADKPIKDCLDSIDIIEAIMEVESEYHVNIDDNAPAWEASDMTLD